ncbi:hypothetical protein Q783_10365 [Carnobacterium inhibens subsp. gilichinskyi]|uniref:Uncharacterized protein n=1 Tax=Carnobacterium inhibens subsp. gilichinskyi TaxID=1266845 RepID=U5SCA9_9LACT|nr:hypothetical protein Q783_10365 [Carnobacterium inhibens subsp. gilichinskyi]
MNLQAQLKTAMDSQLNNYYFSFFMRKSIEAKDF